MFFSIVIPARNEDESIKKTVLNLLQSLHENSIYSEIIIVDDGSTDKTEEVVKHIITTNSSVRYIKNMPLHGFGLAVRKGLEVYRGDAVAILMADGSDSAEDVVRCYKKLKEGYDCVFGSRFIKGSKVKNYPVIKLILNRIANYSIKILFALKTNDVTNGFKCYRRKVIEGIKPILSVHFNLTVELPLKAIVRKYSYAVIPISWHGREKGMAKFRIKEMGSRYVFIILYALLEKWLSKGDYIQRENN
ncbi:MAG: glycosyltransferase family 2 protein [bacterium]|nr:glycosyltransferase family 2 protein [bacterium]